MSLQKQSTTQMGRLGRGRLTLKSNGSEDLVLSRGIEAHQVHATIAAKVSSIKPIPVLELVPWLPPREEIMMTTPFQMRFSWKKNRSGLKHQCFGKGKHLRMSQKYQVRKGKNINVPLFDLIEYPTNTKSKQWKSEYFWSCACLIDLTNLTDNQSINLQSESFIQRILLSIKISWTEFNFVGLIVGFSSDWLSGVSTIHVIESEICEEFLFAPKNSLAKIFKICWIEHDQPNSRHPSKGIFNTTQNGLAFSLCYFLEFSLRDWSEKRVPKKEYKLNSISISWENLVVGFGQPSEP